MIRLATQTTRLTPWLGVCCGLLMVGWPIVAQAVEFKPPMGRGVPGRREGGGTRSGAACVDGTSPPITALTPKYDPNTRNTELLPTNVAWTATTYPRFFWYMPKTRAKTATFKLYKITSQLDTNKNTWNWVDGIVLYQTTFTITGNPGIASLSLPSQASIPPLEKGQIYKWSVGLNCDDSNGPNGYDVQGAIQLVPPETDLQDKLAKANALGRIELYGRHGYWVDTLTELADLRYTNPNDATLLASWQELLGAVNLKETVASQPFIQCCQDVRQTANSRPDR